MTSKTFVVVSGSKTAPGAPLLRDAANTAGLDASVVYLDEPDAVSRIDDADVVLFRASPKMLPKYQQLLTKLSEEKKQLLARTIFAFSKINMYKTLAEAGIPTPDSYLISRNDTIREYPAVIKIPNGYQGLGVDLLRSEQDLLKFKNTFANESEFLIQEYIEESKGSDKRLFIVGDTCVASMKRTSQTDDFRANIHLGGSMESYEPTEQEVAYAVATVKAFGLQFAGVDLIDSNKGPLVLEINPSPGFGIQAVSKTTIADEIVKEVLK